MKKSKLLGLLGLDKIIESLQNLLEVRIAMIREEVEETVAEKLAKVLPLLLVVAASTLLIIFASLTLAFYLTEVLGSYVYGFGSVALVYLVMTIILFLLKDSKALKKVFKDSMSKPTKED
ncbi:Putative Holin-X, holin superfamily III [Marivirga sericea]|uniref:Putative Holin-X, holin superfamily III n=1 Tax=Marivirga sericea TaxID=1028 RepID=A0A1X7J3S1_9BACT|nr:phage holin family protein [Marivirga sericea]SMG22152.1 Putative Holin-X, holin superfamily III [Marivirga sericea]